MRATIEVGPQSPLTKKPPRRDSAGVAFMQIRDVYRTRLHVTTTRLSDGLGVQV